MQQESQVVVNMSCICTDLLWFRSRRAAQCRVKGTINIGLSIKAGWCQKERGCAVGQDASTTSIHQCLQVEDSSDVRGMHLSKGSVSGKVPKFPQDGFYINWGDGCGGLVNGRSPPMPIRPRVIKLTPGRDLQLTLSFPTCTRRTTFKWNR